MQQFNKFLELFNNPLVKTRSVTRYSGVIQNNKESLSDHIADVCSLAYLMSRKLISLGVEVDVGKLLERCVVHDFDEVLIGDIPRLTKYATKTIHDELDQIARVVAKGVSEQIDGTDYTYQVWDQAKDKSVEGFILKVVDILSVSKKVIEEIDFSSNMTFCKVADEVRLYVGDLVEIALNADYLPDEAKNYLVEVLNGTLIVMTDICKENATKIDTYGIVDDITSYILDNRDKN